MKTGGWIDFVTPKVGTDVWQTQYYKRATLVSSETRKQVIVHVDYTAPYHCSINSPMDGQYWEVSPPDVHLTPTRCTEKCPRPNATG